MFKLYKAQFPAEAADIERREQGTLPQGWEAALPRFKEGDKAVATRKLSEALLASLSHVVPELVSGSADLTPSKLVLLLLGFAVRRVGVLIVLFVFFSLVCNSLTRWKDAVDFQPASNGLGDYSGRYMFVFFCFHSPGTSCAD